MGSDWKRLIGTVTTGLIFSFLVAKLIIYIVTAFKDHNLTVSRAQLAASGIRDPDPVRHSPGDMTELGSRVGDDNSVWGDDDDWEEVGSTDLDGEFSSSATFGSGSGQAHVGSSSWVVI